MDRAAEQGRHSLIIHTVDRSTWNLRDWADLGDRIVHGIDVCFGEDGLDLQSRGGRLKPSLARRRSVVGGKAVALTTPAHVGGNDEDADLVLGRLEKFTRER